MEPPFITGIFTITGVLLGASLGYFTSLWKSVTDFRASCRLVKHEIEMNIGGLKCVSEENLEFASSHDVADDLWRASQTNFALLLPEAEWGFLARHYATLRLIQRGLGDVKTMTFDDRAGFKSLVDQTIVDMAIFKDIIGEFESTPRPKLFIHAIRGRTNPAKATRQAY